MKKMMLIVDDIEINRAVLAECFGENFTILQADDGNQAMKLIAEYGDQLAIVLLDIIMPQMDGIAVLKWMKASGYGKLPVIAVTAEATYQVEALENGAWDFITKPTDNQVLRARVNNVLGRYALEEEQRHSAELSKANLEMDNLINSIPGGIAKYKLTDKGFETLYFSDGVAALTGHTRAEYLRRIGADAATIIYEEDRARLVDATIAALKQGKTVDETYRIYHKDGSLVWVHLNGTLIGEEDGAPIMHAVFQRPHHMAQLYENIVNESQNVIYVSDVNNFDLLYVNSTGLKALGKENADYSGKKCYEFLFDQPAPCAFCKLGKLCAECYYERDFTYPKNGRVYAMRGKLTDWNGLSAHVEYIQDITEVKAAEQHKAQAQQTVEKLRAQAQEALDRYLLLVNTVPGGIVQYEVREGQLLTRFFSDGMSALTGYDKEERAQLDSEGTMALTYAEDQPVLMSTIQSAVSKKQPIDLTYRIKTKSGKPRWVRLNAAYSAGPQGEVLYQAVFTDVDQQKQTEKTLQENQLRYEAAIHSSGINIWEYDIQKDSLYIAATSARIKQNCFRVENYVESTLKNDFVRKDSIPKFLSIFERLRQGEREVTEDIWYKTTDEAGWWCERVTYAATVDSAGKPSKAFGAGRDVTREKNAENKFNEEMSYRKAIQSGNLAAVTLDLSANRVLEVESSFEILQDLADGTAEQYFERVAKSIVGEEFLQQYNQMFSIPGLLHCFEGGEYVTSMELTRTYDGNRIYWIKYSAYLIRTPDTNHVIAHIAGVDITQEKVMQTIMETIAQTDYDSFVMVEGAFDSALGYGSGADVPFFDEHKSYEGQMEQWIRSCVCAEDVERVVAECKIDPVWEQVRNGGTHRLSFGMRMSDGQTRHKQLQFAAISPVRKTFLISRIDVNDIYEEQHAAKDMLQSALLAAEQGNSAKTDFLARMSHEIRTPMNAIIGMTAIAAQSMGDEELVSDCLSKIGISSRFLLSLINDILDMSRIESGKTLLKSEKIPFEEFMNGVNSICYAQAQGKNIDYENIIDANLEDYYMGDAMKLQQVLINILSNAIKFTPEAGKVSMHVQQLRKTKNDAVLSFCVNDTGCGISEEFIPHLFDPFAQEHSGTTTSYGGTGLGLAICKHLVEMMDGRITVRSIVGVGSEFKVEVKLGITEESKSRYVKKQHYSFSELEVLVVDDDVTVCEHAMITLKEMGVKSEWVDSGIKAVELVQQKWSHKKYYDIILVDWKMPDMDGIETARQIRQIVGPDVTIIIMTAYDWAAIEHKAKQAGVNLLMSKPMFKSSLLSAFEKAFSTKQEESATALGDDFRFDGKRVLLAEDHPLNVEVATRLLERRGFSVEHAENGLRALELFTTAPDDYYDVILMDIRMPHMDGLQAANAIRHLTKKTAKSIPIIAMTANAFEDDVQKSKAAGMNAHLSKPIEPQQMFQTLYDFLYGGDERENDVQ